MIKWSDRGSQEVHVPTFDARALGKVSGRSLVLSREDRKTQGFNVFQTSLPFQVGNSLLNAAVDQEVEAE